MDALFARLDGWRRGSRAQRYLVGDQLTEADIRLFTTLVRFDACLSRALQVQPAPLVDYPNLWGYARDLYQRPGFGETVDFDQIKRHYYMTHDQINPTRIVPKGPDHRLGGSARPRATRVTQQCTLQLATSTPGGVAIHCRSWRSWLGW